MIIDLFSLRGEELASSARLAVSARICGQSQAVASAKLWCSSPDRGSPEPIAGTAISDVQWIPIFVVLKSDLQFKWMPGFGSLIMGDRCIALYSPALSFWAGRVYGCVLPAMIGVWQLLHQKTLSDKPRGLSNGPGLFTGFVKITAPQLRIATWRFCTARLMRLWCRPYTSAIDD